MRFLSLFSGIEAASVAWEPLGWESVAFSEIEPFPCALLKHYHPDTPNLGDITKVTEDQVRALGRIDAVVAGWPCQDASVAGKRKGLINNEGEKTRSGLFFDAVRVLEWARQHGGCRWFIGENVPGLFSLKEGEDFASVLSALTGLEIPAPASGWQNAGIVSNPRRDRWSVAWRVLDAQYFGLAQRRKRIFFVGYFGDWRPAAAVLFERESMRRHTPPSRKSRQITPTIPASGTGTGHTGNGETESDFLVLPQGVEIGPVLNEYTDIASTLDTLAKDGPRRNQAATAVFHVNGHAEYAEGFGSLRREGGDVGGGSENIVTHSLPARYGSSEDGTGRGLPLIAATVSGERDVDTSLSTSQQRIDAETETLIITVRTAQTSSNGSGCTEEGQAYTLDRAQGQAIAFTTKDHGQDATENMAPTMRGGGHGKSHANSGSHIGIMMRSQVRRLTPVECERLQGFPDNYTRIAYGRKPANKCPDGPRYKALGNSKAVPCVRWIGRQVERIEQALTEYKQMEGAN